MIIQNNEKNPNELHDFLVKNGCIPMQVIHDAKYDLDGTKTQEATEIYIEIESEKEQQLTELVNQFMAS